MNKHNYLMALAMNSNVATLHLSDIRGRDTAIPVKIVEVESDSSAYSSPMTTFKCLVVNDDQIKQHAKNGLNGIYGAPKPETVSYAAADVAATREAHRRLEELRRFQIQRVIFNNPATIVIWADGTKTVVKCQEGDVYSKETGLALCFAKKALGNTGNFNDVFHKWIPEEEEVEDKSEGCDNCRFEKRTDKLFTVMTPSGDVIKTPFNWCPTCGRKLDEPEETEND